MKKATLVIVLLTIANHLSAQQFRLNLYSAYVFDDHFESYANDYDYFKGDIEGSYQWGVGLEFFLKPLYSLEIFYQRQDTHAPTTWQMGSQSLVNYEDFEFDMNYIMLGTNRHLIKDKRRIETSGGLMVGVAILNVGKETTGEVESLTKFAWGGRLSGVFWMSEKAGLKLQAQLLSIVQAAGGGAYFGTSGPGVGVSTYSTIYQFGLGGGLVFKIGNQKQDK